MSPENERDRPAKAAPTVSTAISTENSLADRDIEDRQGLERATLARSTSGRCHNCSRVFETLAGAVSHGRSAGHLVEGTYTASYLYVPVEGAS